jgi:hypothetical protein
MKRIFFPLMLVISFVIFISGCLSVETKTYTFEFTSENAGTITLEYYNIISMMDEGEDVSDEDFEDLIENYIAGDEINGEFPNARLIEKTFYEKDNKLCAKAVFEFRTLEQARLYRYEGKGPYMFSLNTSLDTEVYSTSNGSYGGDIMPVVFWSKKEKELHLTNNVASMDQDHVSLLDKYRKWEAGQ